MESGTRRSIITFYFFRGKWTVKENGTYLVFGGKWLHYITLP